MGLQRMPGGTTAEARANVSRIICRCASTEQRMKPRIFVSVPDDRHLDDRRRRLKRAIIGAVAGRGFDVVGFEPEQFGTGASRRSHAWTADRAQALLRRCDGLLVLALARTHIHLAGSVHASSARRRNLVPKPVPTPYNHLEGALGLSLGIPILVVFESGMDRDGIFYSGFKPAEIPRRATKAWATSDDFLSHLPDWIDRIQARRDIFLGYCSKGNEVARELRVYLERLGFTVMDWSRDFKAAGATILEEIERAASLCRSSIFVFTRDDELSKNARGKASFDAVPRDNVLFEAGYFMHVRGKSRVAIVREAGTKMPVDLGGVIYLSFSDRGNLAATKRGLRKFMTSALAAND